MDFHLVVGIPSQLVRFPTTWMEIQPMGLVGLDVAVMHLRLKMKFLGAILVHPVRRQNFAGTGAP